MVSEESPHIKANFQFYGEIRFKQLTLMMAWLSIAGVGIAQFGQYLIVRNIQLREIIAVASLLVTSVIWVMEVRSSIFGAELISRYPQLWPVPSKNFMPFVSATSVVLGFYIAVYAFWLWCVYEWRGTHIIFWISSAAFGFLLIFSIENYRRYYSKSLTTGLK